MAYEIDGKEFTEEDELKGLEYDCFAVYKTVVVMGGMIEGGVYDTEYEAVEAARKIVLDLYGSELHYHSDEAGGQRTASTATMNEEELSEALIDHDNVAFATVAEREVLFS
jgi:hypothetical protein